MKPGGKLGGEGYKYNNNLRALILPCSLSEPIAAASSDVKNRTRDNTWGVKIGKSFIRSVVMLTQSSNSNTASP
jgi:hypothetical protein